jgi:glycosyltransferase involved in cell wall biosynthesis
MHLVLVSTQHHPTHGGIGAYVFEFIHAARDAGWHIDLVTRPSLESLHPPADAIHTVVTDDMKPEFAQRIPALRRIERIRPYRYGSWSLAIAQKLLDLDIDPDVIEFVDCQAEGFVSLTSRAVRTRFDRTKFVVSSHTPMWLHEHNASADASRFGRFIYHEWERRALGAADGVIAPSDALLRRLGLEQPSIALCCPMRPSNPHSPPTSQVILLVGAVQPQKGVDTWARSLNRVLMARPRASAMLIGADTPTAPDGLSMAAHVQRLIDPRCIDRFKWMGSMPHEHVVRLMRDAAMVVVPSVYESFSYAAAEALMCGRPVIVSDAVGLNEHAPGMWTIPVGDSDALADAQLEILGDPARAHGRADELRRALLAASSPQRHIAKRATFLESLPIAGARPFDDQSPEAMHAMTEFLRDIDQAAASELRPSRPVAALMTST